MERDLKYFSSPSASRRGSASTSDSLHSVTTIIEDPKVPSHGEKRATHNLIERQRRESLNSRFQDLAHALPSLQSVLRPSKSVIVHKSLEFIYDALRKQKQMDNQIHDLQNANRYLMAQLEQARREIANLTGTEPQPINLRLSPPQPARSEPAHLSPSPSISTSSTLSSFVDPEAQSTFHHKQVTPMPHSTSTNTNAMDYTVRSMPMPPTLAHLSDYDTNWEDPTPHSSSMTNPSHLSQSLDAMQMHAHAAAFMPFMGNPQDMTDYPPHQKF